MSNKAKSPQDNFSVLIPDGEHYYLMTILDCLSHIKGIKIYIMSDKKFTAMRYSRYIEDYAYFPKTANDLEWISHVNRTVEKHQIDVLLPIYEKRIKTLVYKGEHLTHKEKLVPLPSPKFYEIAADKWLLAKHLKKQEIDAPESLLLQPNALDMLENMNLSFPVMAKRTQGTSGGDGIHKFETRVELLAHFSNAIKWPYLIQEYVKGHDVGCNVICRKGEILAFTMQKGTMWGKKMFSPQIGLNMIYEKQMFETVKALMKSLDWSGVANVDLRYDEDLKTYKVLEINPRYWATLHASLLAKVNFPQLLCLTARNRTYPIPTYAHIPYLSLYALIKKIGRHPLFILNLRFMWRNTPLKYKLRDPLPNIYRLFRTIKNILVRKVGNQSSVS